MRKVALLIGSVLGVGINLRRSGIRSVGDACAKTNERRRWDSDDAFLNQRFVHQRVTLFIVSRCDVGHLLDCLDHRSKPSLGIGMQVFSSHQVEAVRDDFVFRLFIVACSFSRSKLSCIGVSGLVKIAMHGPLFDAERLQVRDKSK